MAEVVDSIVAELILRYEQYEQGTKRVIEINKELRASIEAAGGDDKAVDQASQRQIASRRKQTDAEKAAAREARDAVKAAAKEKADAERDQAKLAAEAVKAAERDKQNAAKATAKEQAAAATAAVARADAEKAASAAAIAAAEKEAAARVRLAAVVAAGLAQRGTGGNADHGPRSAPESPSAGFVGNDAERLAAVIAPTANDTGAGAELATQQEINHALADRYDMTQKVRVAEGEVKKELTDELEFQRRLDVYRRAGIEEAAAITRAEAETLAVEKFRTEQAEKQALAQRSGGSSGALRFAEGAGLGRTGGSLPAIGGIVAAATIAGVAELAKQGLEYALSLKQDSDQLGLTTRDLQIYRAAAQSAGVTTEQFKQAFGQLADNLGRAQEGGKAQSLIFQRLHIDVGNAKDGFKSLSDVLPSLSDRLSQITDKTERQAIEQAIGGEQLRKLDPILSQGSAAFDKYAQSIEKAGGVLSNSAIQRSAETAKRIALLNDQLQRDLAGTVSNNAKAIEDLATAFFRLADGALKAFGYLRRVDNLDVINGGLSARVREGVTGTSQSDDRRTAYKSLLESPDGRKALLDRNAQTLNALNAANNGGVLDNHAPDLLGVQNNPQARYAAHQKALSERATILRVQKAYDDHDKQGQAPVQPGHPDTNELAGPD